MYDVSNNTAPTLIKNLFTKTSNKYSYNTKSATSGIRPLKLNSGCKIFLKILAINVKRY